MKIRPLGLRPLETPCFQGQNSLLDLPSTSLNKEVVPFLSYSRDLGAIRSLRLRCHEARTKKTNESPPWVEPRKHTEKRTKTAQTMKNDHFYVFVFQGSSRGGKFCNLSIFVRISGLEGFLCSVRASLGYNSKGTMGQIAICSQSEDLPSRMISLELAFPFPRNGIFFHKEKGSRKCFGG